MRRRFPVLFVMALAVLPLPRPASAWAPVTLESKGGVCAARLRGDLTESGVKRGFVGGIGAHWNLNSRLALQTEVLYAAKGNTYAPITDPVFAGTPYTGTFNTYLHLAYVEVPLLLRARLAGGPVRPALMAGPVVGIKASEAFELRGPSSDDLSWNNNAGTLFEMAVTGGFGLELGPPSGCVTLEARVSTSVMDMQQARYPGDFRSEDLRVMVGWKSRLRSFFDRD